MLLFEVSLEVLSDCLDLLFYHVKAVLPSQVKNEENCDVFFHGHGGKVLLV
jgi:hypothetical protein